MEGSHVAADSICPAFVCHRRALQSLALAVGKRHERLGRGDPANHLYGLAQVLLIRSFAYISHRLALRAEIGENRLIVTIWSGAGRSNRINRFHRTSSHG